MDKQKQIEEMRFKVIDNKTSKEADICEIALKEDWAKDLIYCDMQGFAILDDGTLVLLDERGKYVYCPNGRFSVIPENAVVLTREEYNALLQEQNRLKQIVDRIPCGYELKNKTRTETAEKFAERLKEKLEENSPIAGYDLEDLEFDGETIQECIDEICKEITEGGGE